MKAQFLMSAGLALFFSACVGSKDFTVRTQPEGAEISINGKVVGTSPVTLQIKQDKDLGIVAQKTGYQVAAETVPTKTNRWLGLIWTNSDPKAQYIEEDEIMIPMQKIASPRSYVPSVLPAYTGGEGRLGTSSRPPELPPLPAN